MGVILATLMNQLKDNGMFSRLRQTTGDTGRRMETIGESAGSIFADLERKQTV
jgi:hypothetical protein